LDGQLTMKRSNVRNITHILWIIFFAVTAKIFFPAIENEFIVEDLPKFRGANLSTTDRIELENIKLSRLFWLIQFWRNAVCVPDLKIPPAIADKARLMILDHATTSKEQFTFLPMSVTYLQTDGEPHEMTRNFVGFIDRKNPLIIFMCDFILQVFESEEQIVFEEMLGLNSTDFREFINHGEEKFKVKILNDVQRNDFI
jgi:hypothetical protein